MGSSAAPSRRKDELGIGRQMHSVQCGPGTRVPLHQLPVASTLWLFRVKIPRPVTAVECPLLRESGHSSEAWKAAGRRQRFNHAA